MSDRPSFFNRRGVVLLLVAICATAVFLPSVRGGWIYDDRPLIADNPYIHSFHWIGRWFSNDFWDVSEELVRLGSRIIYWRPLVTGSYALDWHIGGGSPVVFHLMNALYQAIVGALAFVVLRRWIGAVWPAALAAVLFAIHPTKAESVAWIAGRTDVLCMIAILIACEGMGRRLTGRRWGIPIELAGTVLAYLCKEQAIVLPVFAAVEAWVAADRPAIELSSLKRIIVKALPQAGVAIGYLAVRAVEMPIVMSAGGSRLSLPDHVQSVLDTFGRFFVLTFAPHALSIQQGLVQWKHGVLLHSTPYMVVGALGLVALVGLAIWLRRRWPIATVGIGLYLVALLPTSNIRYTDMRTLVSERFLYLPIFGLVLVIGAGLARMRGPWLMRSYAILGSIALALAAMSMSRSADFADEATFWRREKALHSDSRVADSNELRVALAAQHYQTALRILLEKKAVIDRYDPVDPEDVGIAYLVAQTAANIAPDRDVEDLRKIDAFCRDMLDPNKPSAELSIPHVQLGIAEKGRSYEDKLRHFEPQLLALRATIHSRLGDDKEAVDFAAQASVQCGSCTTVFVTNAVVHARAGQYDDADRVLQAVADRAQERPLASARSTIAKARAAHDEASRTSGPAQLRARASELSALEAWGRAYDVLAPYKDEIMRAPRFAMGFAELAFRAGEPAVARDVLAGNMPADEIDSLLAQWAASMGWSQ